MRFKDDPERVRAAYAKYAASHKGRLRAAKAFRKRYAKAEERARMLAANRRWHADNERYPRAIESTTSLIKALQEAIAEHEKQD